MRTTRRKVHRSDVNAKDIIAAARKLGVFVIPIGRPTDLICGVAGRWYFVELKHGKKGRYTEDQKVFIALCALENLPVLTWRSVEDVRIGVESIKRQTYYEVSHGNTQRRSDLADPGAHRGALGDLAH